MWEKKNTHDTGYLFESNFLAFLLKLQSVCQLAESPLHHYLVGLDLPLQCLDHRCTSTVKQRITPGFLLRFAIAGTKLWITGTIYWHIVEILGECGKGASPKETFWIWRPKVYIFGHFWPIWVFALTAMKKKMILFVYLCCLLMPTLSTNSRINELHMYKIWHGQNNKYSTEAK